MIVLIAVSHDFLVQLTFHILKQGVENIVNKTGVNISFCDIGPIAFGQLQCQLDEYIVDIDIVFVDIVEYPERYVIIQVAGQLTKST